MTLARRCPTANATSYTLPFAHLNLRFNPFGEIPLEHRAELAIVEIECLVEQLRDRKLALQFVGDRGRGKTTHLLAVKRHFPHAAYVHIPEAEKPPIPRGDPLLIDEAQRLPRWQRFRVFRRNVPLILGTHQDFTKQLLRAGRRVVTIDVSRAVTANRLSELLARRIEFARRNAGPVPRITPSYVGRLLAEYGSDVRAIEGHLYDVFQNLLEIADVEV